MSRRVTDMYLQVWQGPTGSVNFLLGLYKPIACSQPGTTLARLSQLLVRST